MKANEAPEKIYLQVCGDCQDNKCDSCKFENLEDNVTWCKYKIFDKDIEYTRTDFFIEKASEWFKKRYEWIDIDGTRNYDKSAFENFKEYMEDKL